MPSGRVPPFPRTLAAATCARLARFTCMIRKLKSGEYRLYSRKKGDDGKCRNLGTFSSRSAAEKHEREVQGFKHRG